MIHLNQTLWNQQIADDIVGDIKTPWPKPPKPPTVGRESLPTSNNPDLCNAYVTMTSDYTDRFCINYPI